MAPMIQAGPAAASTRTTDRTVAARPRSLGDDDVGDTMAARGRDRQREHGTPQQDERDRQHEGGAGERRHQQHAVAAQRTAGDDISTHIHEPTDARAGRRGTRRRRSRPPSPTPSRR